MKSKILAIAMAAALFFSLNASAQNRQGHRECTDRQCALTDNPDSAFCRADAGMLPFSGLNLTEAQSEQIAKLNKERIAAKKARSAEFKDAKTKQQNRRCEDRRNYLASVKSILTPEQYTTFLENQYVNGQGKGTKNFNKKFHKNNHKACNSQKKGNRGTTR